MAKATITQETFDEIVKENIIEFAMSPEEAKDETVKQFEAQGINLANIIKDLTINGETGDPVLYECIEILKNHVNNDKLIDHDGLIKNLNILEAECKKSVAHRVVAGKNGAHEVILSIIENELKQEPTLRNLNLLVNCFHAKTALALKNPDIFDVKALTFVVECLEVHQDHQSLLTATLQYIPKVCFMHEMNRQNIMEANIIKYLKPLIKSDNCKIVRGVCEIFRCLILDDDIRVEFGKAHEHARLIASEVLIDLTNLLPVHSDINVLSDLMLTIAALVVRQEFCVAVEEAGGLEFIFDLMKKYPTEIRLNKEALKLLKALGGHDQVKNKIVQKGAPPVIHSIMEANMQNESLIANALACISKLTLRVKENSTAFFETGIAETIVECMRNFPKSKTVQRNASWAIRNMVSRSREQCETFLSYGAEDLLNEALKTYPDITHDVKAALRDLGCKVELKEEWTGKADKIITN